MADPIPKTTDMTNPPQRLAATNTHPWFDPYWSKRADVYLNGEKRRFVLIANADEGWIEGHDDPPQREGSVHSLEGARLIIRRWEGEVRIVPKGAAL